MTQLVLLRHGQSRWNLENRFTGWVDVELTPEGVNQARRAGELIKAEGIRFDHAFTSVLRRAIETCRIAMQTAGQPGVPEEQDWRLNERHYGGLTGLDKAETAARYGDEQVKVWRRSYDVPPPPMEPGHPHDSSQDPRYNGKDIPDTESLKTTLERVLPYWEAQIGPRLKAGRPVLVAAHGNSLRAILKHLFGLADDQITEVEIPTGNPLLIELDDQLRPTSARYLDEGRAQPLPPLP